MKYLYFLIVVILLSSCVEKIDFDIANEKPGIVIEGFVSNKSYLDVRDYPSEGRYFTVRLGQFSAVTNRHDVAIVNADVVLIDDLGNQVSYLADPLKEGFYYIGNPSFRVQFERTYKLKVTLDNGNEFESEWEKMMSPSTEVGDFSMEEIREQKYVLQSNGESELRTFDGVNISVNIPQNTDSTHYFHWRYKPLWIYSAPDPLPGAFNKRCWVTNSYYLKHFTYHEDLVGGYDRKLFYIQTQNNDRTYEYMSALVIQSRISKKYYNFWKDLDAQTKKGGLFDQPPYNLPTNFKAINNDWSVAGFFGVVTEQGERWVLDYDQLSYEIDDDVYELCLIDYGPLSEQTGCEDCRYYNKGDAVNSPPWWW